MAPRQAKQNIQKVGRQRSVPKDKKARPQVTKKERPQLSPRKSTGLKRRQDRSPTSNTPGTECQQNRSTPLQDQDRKRAREPKESPIPAPSKRPRTSAHSALGDTFGHPVANGVTDNKTNSIAYWIQNERWPTECFEQEVQTQRDFEKDSWLEKYWEPESNMNHLLAKTKSSSYNGSKQSEASPTSVSNQKPRNVKSAPYQQVHYETLLATKGSFMGKSELSATATSKNLCRIFLETEQIFPEDSLFHDDLFEETCEMVRNKKEARVVRDILPLIVPSAEILAIRGAKHLKILIESVNEGWNNCIPITKTRPQPDYSVAFRREAFTEDQLKRIGPFVGEFTDTSFLMATYSMYFPFVTCEAKCGTAALDVADRQNAHSMTLAVRGVVELFRLVKREKELHREILAFSVSHDHRTVRIYGHYPIIDGKKTTFYRHPIKMFDFTSEDGKEKWTAYKFIKNVYDIWMPTHFKRICSVIDELPPDVDFEVSELGESGLLQGLDLSNRSSQSSHVPSRDITQDTSLSQNIERRASKRRKKRSRPIELHQ